MCSSKSGNVIAHCRQRDPRTHGIGEDERRKKNTENKNIKRNSKRRDEKEMKIGWREGR